MDSLALVILGSSVLKVGLWFAENILYSVIRAGCKESFGNVITAVSSNLLALFASHTQERLRVRAVAIVFQSTMALIWKIWGGSGALWDYLSRGTVSGVLIIYDGYVYSRSRVCLSPLRSLQALTLIVLYGLISNVVVLCSILLF